MSSSAPLAGGLEDDTDRSHLKGVEKMVSSTLESRLFIDETQRTSHCGETCDCPIEVTVTICQPPLTVCMAVSP